jgi:hypothetical protein
MLTTALRESRGYLQDQGWHQTARLMSFAAEEIERLSERVRDLENEARPGRTGTQTRTSAASSSL